MRQSKNVCKTICYNCKTISIQMSQFLVRRAYRISFLCCELALFVNVIQIDGERSGRPAAVYTPYAVWCTPFPFSFSGVRFPAGGCQCQFAQSNCNFLLRQQKEWRSNAGSAQQVPLSGEPCA